jgi:hypothetical protein
MQEKNKIKIVDEMVLADAQKITTRISRRGWVLGGFVVFLVLVALAVLMRQNLRLRNDLLVSQKKSQNTPAVKAEEIEQANKELVTAVGRLLVLPTDESPTIATVTDLAKLQDQPFFANALVGDRVLIYANAKKAILYRESENKVIELAPLNIGTQENPQKLNLEIRNGSGKNGLAVEFKNRLSAKSEFNVFRLSNAKALYPKTQIIILDKTVSENLLSELKQLSDGAVVYALPQGEAISLAQVVLILGQDSN